MTIEEGLYAHLTAPTSHTYPLAGTRVYPLIIPQDVSMPAIAYQRVDGDPILAHDGQSKLVRATFQLTCQAKSYATVKAMATALRKDLAGYRGLMGSVSVNYCNQINEVDSDEMLDASLVRADFTFLYQEN